MPRDPDMNEFFRVVMDLAETAPAAVRAEKYRWLAAHCGDESIALHFNQLAGSLEVINESHGQLYLAMGLGNGNGHSEPEPAPNGGPRGIPPAEDMP